MKTSVKLVRVFPAQNIPEIPINSYNVRVPHLILIHGTEWHVCINAQNSRSFQKLGCQALVLLLFLFERGKAVCIILKGLCSF